VLKRFGGIGAAIVIAIVVLALKFGAGLGIGFLGAKAEAPDVGQCVTVSGSSTDADVDEADCDDDGVLYKVQSDDGKCDPSEVKYTVEVTGGADAVHLCLDWDVAAGECVKIGTDFDELVDCKEKGSQAIPIVRIVSVEDGADAKCAKKAIAAPNQKRDFTICAVPNL
jgi:hypothetical protein